MGLVVMGLSHKTAPVEIRERLTIPSPQLGPVLDRLHSLKELQETVILSTCNRLEIYSRPDANRANALAALRAFFHEFYKIPNLDSSLYQHEGDKAVLHLFRVSSGLDSMVVGESEVLGQVKSAYVAAQSRGVTGKITNVLFQRALFVGKHVRTHTDISKGSSSVGSIAVHLAERVFGSLVHRPILLLGAGKMAEVTARHLLSQKADQIVVLNRTLSKAQDLAQLLNGTAQPLDQLEPELTKADIVLCSLSCERPVITASMMESIMKARRDRSIYFVDISVPRNVEERVGDIDNAYVYNIDDLQELVDENMSRRKKDVQQAEKIVSDLAQEFYGWIRAVLEGRSAALTHGQPKSA